MVEPFITPKEVNPYDAETVLSFLNAVNTAPEIAEAIEIIGERDIGIKIAQRILARREELKTFTDLQQVADVEQIGPERFAELVTALSKNRSYTSGRFALIVDGSEPLGFVKSVSGGSIKGELSTHQLGSESVSKKRITTVSYESFTVEVGMGMTNGLFDWIHVSLDKGDVSKSGEFIACDFDYKLVTVREFYAAHISEVTIPELDGSSKAPAYMTVKIDPEGIRYKKGDGSRIQGEFPPASKKWLSSNFRFELDPLPCQRVAKIDSFTWKQGVIKDEVGQFREATKRPAKVEVPNIKLTISMADLQPWLDWHRTFIIEGLCDEGEELNGKLEFLGPDMEEILATIELLNVGIISLDTAWQEAEKEEVARFTVELYVEEMKFQYTVSDA